MNKIIFIIIIQILFSNKLFSQIWSMTNGPTVGVTNTFGANSNGILFATLNPTSGAKYNFCRSTNNGLSWRSYYTLSQSSYDMIVKNDIIYLATSEGIMKSTNNGVNWDGFAFSQISYSVFSSQLNNNFFTGNSVGGIYRSTNGGVGWAHVLDVNYLIHNITGDSSSNIFASGNNVAGKNILFKSSDSGNSWDSVFRINTTINCINYIGNGLLFAGTSDSGLFTSTNYGSDWARLNTPFSSTFSISKNNFNKIVITSESGLWSTINNGQSWIFINGVVQDLKEIFFTPSNLLLAGTTHGIYKSTNEGNEWQNSGLRQSVVVDIDTRRQGKIYSIAKLNDNVFALWSSTNEGGTWIKTLSTNNFMFKVASFDSNVYVAALNITRSTNNGYDFQEVFNPGTQCFKIITDSLGNIYAGFENGFYRSTNSGTDWTRINNITHVIYDIYIVNQNLMYACGFGKIYRSTDGGTIWSMIFNMGTDIVNIAATASGYIIIDGFGIYRSSNFGQTWNSLGISLITIEHFMFDKRDNFYCMLGDDIYKSTNFGTDFELFNSGLPGNNTCIGLAPDDYLFLGTFGASVYKTNSPLTNLNYESILVENLKLFQNYPNPFNPSTEIKFEIPKKTLVMLKVYDILGKEISLLVNNVLESGTHSVEFSGENLPSGIYFYKIEAGNLSYIRKMILLK